MAFGGGLRLARVDGLTLDVRECVLFLMYHFWEVSVRLAMISFFLDFYLRYVRRVRMGRYLQFEPWEFRAILYLIWTEFDMVTGILAFDGTVLLVLSSCEVPSESLAVAPSVSLLISL